MLLHENSGDGDETGHHTEGNFPGRVLQFFAAPCGKHDRQRSNDMNGWADIGVCIKGVERSSQSGQKIISLKRGGTQILAGGEDKVDDNGHRISSHDKIHELPEGFYIVQQRVNDDAEDKYEPEQIGNEEDFFKGNEIVQCAVHGKIAVYLIKLLYEHKQKAINRPIE